MFTRFFDNLKQRGLIFQHTDGLDKLPSSSLISYYGIDATSSSLHIGHMLGLIISKRLLDFGGKIIILVGGGTSQIGDPSGKDKERPILSKKEIGGNKKKIENQVKKIMGSVSNNVIFVDNADWLQEVTLIDFLRDVGKEMPLSSMIEKESVKARLTREQGISFAEFSYQLLQAYDFLVLDNKYNCNLQFGGSDQWGNIVQGTDLIRRKTGKRAYGLCFPLIVDPQTGKKFGKTENGNSIWLDPNITHPFEFFQFFINTSDELARTLMIFYSLKPMDEINSIIQNWEQDKSQRTLQKSLAFEMTELVHSFRKAQIAERLSIVLFEKKPTDLTSQDFEFLKKAVPYATVNSEKDFSLEKSLIDTQLAKSKAEARRLISQEGVFSSFHLQKYFLIRKGKKEYGIVEITGK